MNNAHLNTVSMVLGSIGYDGPEHYTSNGKSFVYTFKRPHAQIDIYSGELASDHMILNVYNNDGDIDKRELRAVVKKCRQANLNATFHPKLVRKCQTLAAKIIFEEE